MGIINYNKIIGKYKAFLQGGRRAPPVTQHSEPTIIDSNLLDDVLDIVNRELALGGSRCNRSMYSSPQLPSPPPSPPGPEQRLDGEPDRDTGRKFIIFDEGDASDAPVASTSRDCGGAIRFPPSTSIKPYRVVIKEPINGISEARVACAGAGSGSRQDRKTEPYVEIVEQPEHSKRFRYDSEIGSAGAIHGINSIKNGKNEVLSFPTIKIWNYEGSAIITVSLVCEDFPHRVHPNGLVGKKKTSNPESFPYIYVKQVQVTRMNCTFQFEDLGIRKVKPKQVDDALKLRELQKVDPFNQGYGTRVFSKSDLRKVRLCFHVELVPQKLMLPPEISNVIYDFKKLGCLQIKRLCKCSASNKGGTEIILICDLLDSKDLEVVFYEEENGNVVWEQSVTEMEVYGRTAIVCAAPAYSRAAMEYGTVVYVNIKLRRPSNRTICGDSRSFTYYADDTDLNNRKKRKLRNYIILKTAMDDWTTHDSLPKVDNASLYDQDWRKMPCPGPFDFNPAAPAVSLPKPSESMEPLQANIPMSPDVEPLPSTSPPM